MKGTYALTFVNSMVQSAAAQGPRPPAAGVEPEPSLWCRPVHGLAQIEDGDVERAILARSGAAAILCRRSRAWSSIESFLDRRVARRTHGGLGLSIPPPCSRQMNDARRSKGEQLPSPIAPSVLNRELAVARACPALRHHSDRGSVHASDDYRQALSDNDSSIGYVSSFQLEQESTVKCLRDTAWRTVHPNGGAPLPAQIATVATARLR